MNIGNLRATCYSLEPTPPSALADYAKPLIMDK